MVFKRLSLGDDDVLFPVQAFFNAIGDSSFSYVIRSLLRGVGYSINDAHCFFPDIEDGDDFDGVMFCLYEDEVVVEYLRFLDILSDVCVLELQRRPELASDFDKIFERMNAVRSSLMEGKGDSSFSES